MYTRTNRPNYTTMIDKTIDWLTLTQSSAWGGNNILVSNSVLTYERRWTVSVAKLGHLD